MKKYDLKKVEQKWQKVWRKEGVYEPSFAKKGSSPLRQAQGKNAPHFYNLMMFPYPSAEGLHVGNMYAFTGSDIYGRFQRMNGNDVFEPIGLDGFGIHSENYALKIGAHPAEQAKVSEERFYKQLEAIGNGFAWNEHAETYDPEYYKWTQWLFAEMWKRGLAYRKKQAVNWCPSCKTVLSDEQAEGGKCERCGTVVIKKDLEQWFFKITDYAPRLLKNLETLDWSEKVKIAQKNWIGESNGAEISFPLNIPAPKIDVVFATNNTGKVARMQKLFKAAGLKITLKTPAEVGVTDFDVVEDGKTLAENAEKKARAIAERTGLPAFADDSGFFIDGVELNPITVKRNALKGMSEKSLSIEEIGERVEAYYKSIAASRGGKVDAEWRNALCFVTPEKVAVHAEGIRPVILTDVSRGAVDPHLPIRGLYIPKATGVYALEQSEEEELKELQPVTDALKKLFTSSITVFTTRPDTLFGATYMVLAPEHQVISNLKSQISNLTQVESYIQTAKAKTDEERLVAPTPEGIRGSDRSVGKEAKTGVELKGVKAINPANSEEMPIFVADYVLGGYGTGAIMAVPAHDERDHAFAKKFNLPIRRVVEPRSVETTGDGAAKPGLEFVKRNAVCAVVRNPKNDTYLCVSWKNVHMHGLVTGGIDEDEDIVQAAKREVLEETGYKNLKAVGEPKHIINTFFYHRVKKENRWARFHYVFFELENEERTTVDEKESSLHEVLWKRKEEMRDFFTVFEGDYVMNLIDDPDHIHTGEGILGDSGEFSGMDSEKAKWEITKFVHGERKTQYRLRDWLISRQRYWGPPIPMIFCETCAGVKKGEQAEMPGWYAVPEKDLPVKLPFVKDFRPTGKDESPLASHKEFYEVQCPGCGGKARRETDVSDTFLDSAWYYLRYLDPQDARQPFDKLRAKKWLPVQMYIGGAEHAVLHLLYVRFVAMALHDWGLLQFSSGGGSASGGEGEPFLKFRAHGLLIKDGAKMSKSKGNVVNPDEYIKNFGADALRTYLMFLAPFEQGGDFRDQGILGVTRFLERVWKLGQREWSAASDTTERILHQAIQKVTGDIETLNYNTAVSAMMICLNGFEEHGVAQAQYASLVKLLAPFAPHMAEEIWREVLGHKTSIHLEPWPIADEKYLKVDTFTLVIQVNGKTRDTVEAPAGIAEAEARSLAFSREKVKQFLDGKEPKKVIYVPGRLISIVV